MRRLPVLLAVLTLSSMGWAQTQYVPLNLSNGFNTDLWCGPLELQAVQAAGLDMMETQGGVLDGVGFGVMSGRNLLISNTTASGAGMTYSLPTSWQHPYWITGTMGTPEDGYILAPAGYPYHIASALGNTTLVGDWTEVADPGDAWATRPNGIRIGSYHRISDWQIANATVELPAAQKGAYDSVNFILVAANQADRARNMQIVALYGPDGSDEVVLYAFSAADGGSGPVATDADGGVEFNVALSVTKSYGNDAGPTGAVTSSAWNLYEFAAPLTLDSAKDLWGFRLVDTDPALNYNARGLAVWAATATRAQASNVAPVADAGADMTVYDMDEDGFAEAWLDGTGSSDADGQILRYVWSKDNADVALGEAPRLTLPLGTSVVTLTVTDNSLATDTDSTTIVVTSAPAGAPTADAGADQTVVDADDTGSEMVVLDGGASTDPDGSVVAYQWLIDQAEIATGETAGVELPIGTHTITLKVTDNDGYYGVDTVVVTVKHSGPVADAGADQDLVADPTGSAAVALDGSGSYDPAGSIVSYVWDQGGLQIATGETANITLADGVYDITLTVTDDSGYTDTDTVTIAVAAYIPPATYYLDGSAVGPVFDGSQTNPWQTVEQMQQALADKANNGSGDTVIIAPGSYGELVDGSWSGSGFSPLQERILPRTDWLTLRAADPADKPVFDYMQIYGSRDAYLELDGLEVSMPLPRRSACVYVRNNTRHLRLRNLDIHTVDDHTQLPTGILVTYLEPSDILIEGCDIYSVGVGMSMGASNLLVRNNEVHDNCGSGIATGAGDNVVVEGNYIHDQIWRTVRVKLYGAITGSFNYGELVTQDVTGATGTVYATDATGDWVEIYVTKQVDHGFELGYSVSSTSGGTTTPLTDIAVSDTTHASGLSVRTSGYTARGNTIVRYGASSAMKTYEYLGGAEPFTNMLFENNLVYDAIEGHTAMFSELGENCVFRNNTWIGNVAFYFHSSNDGSGLKLCNNICKVFTFMTEPEATNVVERNNVFTYLVTREPGYNTAAQFAQPSTSIRWEFILYDDEATFAPFWELFNDPDNKDFSLAADSVAIGAADPAYAPAVDITGEARDSAPDAGAFEWYGAPCKPGDANSDGGVDLEDFVILKTNFGRSGAIWAEGDFDGDGDVDLEDFVILKTNFGT